MNDKFHACIKFIGPENEDGAVDIAKAAKTMLALDRWARKYQKEFAHDESRIELKINDVKKNCSELDILIQSATTLLQTGALTTVGAIAWKQLGFHEFCKKFMGTLGEQIALKKVLKNDKPESVSEPYLRDGKPVIDVITKDGKTHTVSAEAIDIHRKTQDALNGFNTLVPGENTEMKVGYYDNSTQNDVVAVTPSDRSAFTDPDSSQVMEQRLDEGFSEDKAKEVTLYGRFLDYRGMATKYRFSFQARKNTKEYGRQKILCIVEDPAVEASLLDLLKPQNKKDIALNGLATKSWDGNLDKLKVNWVNENPNYDPKQLEMLYLDSIDIDEDEQEESGNE